MKPEEDGSAGDINYGVIGHSYSRYRQPELAIAAIINRALGLAQTVVNVGAGAGSYEPLDRQVTPVEPSSSMRSQRPHYFSTAIDAIAEELPFPDGHFDAAMTTFSVHQWTRLDDGLREMRRVARGPVIILSCDPALVQRFWLNDYAPEVLAVEARRYPSLDHMADVLGGRTVILPVPIPLSCSDGFNEAYYGRPERLLDPAARLACSAWSFVSKSTTQEYVEHLQRDLESGEWDRKYGHLRTQHEFDGSLRLLISQPESL
jgi:SAM-dependent methyltransferase